METPRPSARGLDGLAEMPIDDRKELMWQLLRYGAAGIVLAALYSAIYWGLAARGGVSPQLANLTAFTANLALGWLLHSRWSFRGYGLSGRQQIMQGGFIAINLLGYALNSLWVWLVVGAMHRSVAQSLVPIVLVTPSVNFALNRVLLFRRRL